MDLGYRRRTARVGVRNHVVVLPVDDLSNAVCQARRRASAAARWRCRTPTAGSSTATTSTCTSGR